MKEEGSAEIATPEVLQYLHSHIFQIGHAACFIAYHLGMPVGVITASWHPGACPGYYEFAHLYVRPSQRGNRIAASLISAAVDWASQFGDAPVMILTKGSPRGYYQHLGFATTHNLCLSDLKTVRERL